MTEQRPLTAPSRTGVASDGVEPAGDVLIVGGSLNGATLALALARAGLEVTVIDALADADQAAAGFDGRSYALALASVKMLSALGLWADLKPDAQPIVEVKVSDGRPGEGAMPFILHFDQAEIEEGPLGQMVEDRHLRRVLLAAIEAHPRIARRPSSRVADQRAGGSRAVVRLDDETSLSAPVVVGADGRQGPTAGRAGIGRRQFGYGQSALVCAVAHARPHGGVAHQFFMPEGPLAILPLKGNRSSVVWTQGRRQAAAVQALDDEGYLQVLRPRFGDFLGALSLEGDRYAYPLGLSLAESFVAPRLALVGDAARALHPIAGQGLNAGLRDTAALAEVLVTARRRGEDIGAPDVLARYARWRRFDTATLALATDGFARLFSSDNALLRIGRNLGVGVVQAVPALRRGFMREAAGLTGDVPTLLRGRPL